MPKFDEKSARHLADEYGFAYSFLRSDPSLYKLFKDAVKGSWDEGRFVAKLKTTHWYKTSAESARQFDLLKTSDPATYRARLAAIKAQIGDAAKQLGASINGNTLNHFAEQALRFNYNDNQMRDLLSSHVKAVNGVYLGETGDAVDHIKQIAYKNGVHLSSTSVQGYAQAIAAGKTDANTVSQQIRGMAKSFAPSYADQLDAGLDLTEVAGAYSATMAKILELNPADVDLFDPTIRRALSSKNKDGKPESQSLWQFESSLKKDPRWLKTANAQDSVMGGARKVLQDFGFAS